MTSSEKELLKEFKSKYSKDVMYTNGLFHIMNNKHEEQYINIKTKELNKKFKFNTIVVLDKVIVSEVLNSHKYKYAVINKDNLDFEYITSGTIEYIDKNIVYDSNGKGSINIISHTGKVVMQLDNVVNVTKIHKSYYLVKSSKMFNDLVIHYNKHRDLIDEQSESNKYSIHNSEAQDDMIEIQSMHGIQYSYDFTTHELSNKFTGNKIISSLIFE